eukprot:scaffold99615_cov63-Phaeocystis_antarctica.AAC.5
MARRAASRAAMDPSSACMSRARNRAAPSSAQWCSICSRRKRSSRSRARGMAASVATREVQRPRQPPHTRPSSCAAMKT